MSDAGRTRQKLRTRKALVDAAVKLVRAGKQPSIVEVAELALVSQATAYRYFANAQALMNEATIDIVNQSLDLPIVDEVGDDPSARLDKVVQTVGWRMFDDEALYRNLTRNALERWFDQMGAPERERAPVREGRRMRWNAKAIEPLRGKLPDPLFDDLLAALALVWGTEAVLALRDAARLDVKDAKRVMRRAAQWMLRGALSENRDD